MNTTGNASRRPRGLGPRRFFDGEYVWELDGTGERGHACSLRIAKRLIEQSFLRHNAVLTGAGQEATGNGAPYHRVRLKT